MAREQDSYCGLLVLKKSCALSMETNAHKPSDILEAQVQDNQYGLWVSKKGSSADLSCDISLTYSLKI
jgi:hypothetical protein